MGLQCGFLAGPLAQALLLGGGPWAHSVGPGLCVT